MVHEPGLGRHGREPVCRGLCFLEIPFAASVEQGLDENCGAPATVDSFATADLGFQHIAAQVDGLVIVACSILFCCYGEVGAPCCYQGVAMFECLSTSPGQQFEAELSVSVLAPDQDHPCVNSQFVSEKSSPNCSAIANASVVSRSASSSDSNTQFKIVMYLN